MKVWVEKCELWPCYDVTDDGEYSYTYDGEIDISEETFARYRRVIDEFFAVQHELAKFFPED